MFRSFLPFGLVEILAGAGCLRRVVGGLGGCLQTQLRVLLGYSSINHNGWLVVSSLYSPIGCVYYYCFYCFAVVVVFYLVGHLELGNLKRVCGSFRLFDVKFIGVLIIVLVRLAGLPPTVGFAIK